MKFGAEFMSDHELIMLLLGSGIKGIPVQKLAASVLSAIRGHNSEEWIEVLIKENGIGSGKAAVICAALELGRRYNSNRGVKITSPKDLIPLVQYYALQPQENFICVSLNGANELLKIRVVSLGTQSRVIIHPREIFSDPLKERAAGIIVCHNHPAGTLEPSVNDIEVTNRLNKAAELLGINFLDHIILTLTGYFSFRESGFFSEAESETAGGG